MIIQVCEGCEAFLTGKPPMDVLGRHVFHDAITKRWPGKALLVAEDPMARGGGMSGKACEGCGDYRLGRRVEALVEPAEQWRGTER